MAAGSQASAAERAAPAARSALIRRMSLPALLQRRLFGAWLVLLICCAGCSSPKPTQTAAPPPTAAPVTVHFADATSLAGITWAHNACRSGRKLLPETVGGGGGFLDFDRDGRLDILLLNGAPMPGYKGPAPRLALYRQEANGRFTEVSRSVGLDYDGYAMGIAVADYDNDGWPDIYITGLNRCALYHNEHGRFVDVTRKAGVAAGGFCTAAAWLDYDGDGRLDLYVARYVVWTPETDLPCGPEGARQYCPPYQYRSAPPILFRNRGDGTFEDVSRRAGILNHSGKTLAVVPCDINGDGWTDLYVANDTEPDLLLLNNRSGGFTEVGLTAALALGSDGLPTGSMGADIATPFRDGRQAIAVGTFAGQEISLFVQHGPNLAEFDNKKQDSLLADSTRDKTTFGLVFADFNLDGWPDLAVVNGHIDDDQSISVAGRSIRYRQPTQLFLNRHDGTFAAADAGITGEIVGRGLAAGDYDNDGKPDLLVFENGGPVRLWHNETRATGHWLGVQLIGKQSPRDGTGATVTIRGRGWTQSRFATTARSYLCANDPRIHFGLGGDTPEELIVRWPGGHETRIATPPIDRYVTVTE